jgi:GR25 family glycosyltransferase involved in LPS biosynthesis
MDVGACFYINLDHRTDRRRHMEAQAGRLGGIPLERWAGIRPTDRNLHTTWEPYTRRGLEPYLHKHLRQRRKRERFYGVIGCYISHVRLMEYMADRFTERDGNVLVFEDDVVIQPGFLDRLRERFEDPVLRDADWDMVRIDCWGARVEELRVSEHVYRLKRSWNTGTQFGGAHAVLYRPSRLPKLLDILASRPIRDIDGLWSFGDLPDVLEHYVIDTGLCWQTDLASDVRPRGPHRLRWKLRRMFAARWFE